MIGVTPGLLDRRDLVSPLGLISPYKSSVDRGVFTLALLVPEGLLTYSTPGLMDLLDRLGDTLLPPLPIFLSPYKTWVLLAVSALDLLLEPAQAAEELPA